MSVAAEHSNAENPSCFADIALIPEVQRAVASAGYQTPSAIQLQAIPALLSGKDILGVAQTGTGKTAAFALPLLSRLDVSQKPPQILCLTPTRELAMQVAEAFKTYAQHIPGFQVLAVYGGTGYRDQINALSRGVHVVVGTPGRLIDHMKKGKLKLDGIQSLVLDEADEMLRMGFIDDVEWILQQMPKAHQTALFSATMPKQIKAISQNYLQDPVEITIQSKTTTAENIHQQYIRLRNHEKLFTLNRILEIEETEATIVFARTKAGTQEIAEHLQGAGFKAEALNGDVAQDQREKIVARLKNGQLDVVTATDVAARGLDVKRISHVINFDAPSDVETYVHRIGRTGRAGRSGTAVLFVNAGNQRLLQNIERTTRQSISEFQFPSLKELNTRKLEKFFATVNQKQEGDLTEYTSVIEKYLAHQKEQGLEVDFTHLAAALASLTFANKPFYLTEAPVKKSAKKERSRSSREPQQQAQHESRRDSQRKQDKPKNRKAEKSNGIPMEAYRVAVGNAHGAKKADIVAAIANEAGVEPKYIGTIDMFETHSFIALPEGMPTDVFKDLQKTWVCGQQLKIKQQKAKQQMGQAKRAEKSAKKPAKRRVKKPSRKH